MAKTSCHQRPGQKTRASCPPPPCSSHLLPPWADPSINALQNPKIPQLLLAASQPAPGGKGLVVPSILLGPSFDMFSLEMFRFQRLTCMAFRERTPSVDYERLRKEGICRLPSRDPVLCSSIEALPTQATGWALWHRGPG